MTMRPEREEMNVLTVTEAQAGLKQVLDDVCASHTPTMITRRRGPHAVLMSLDDYRSMEETLYLLRSPTNANRLMESIAQLRDVAER